MKKILKWRMTLLAVLNIGGGIALFLLPYSIQLKWALVYFFASAFWTAVLI